MFDKQDNWSDWPSLHGKTVAMRKVADNEFRIVYVAAVDGGDWCIRINNFPDEPLYTLIINNEEILHFNDWPSWWLKCN